MLTANQLRQKYLDFFISHGHKVIPSAPLVPENDPTTLFTSAGMQPMMPYLLGQKHPLGTKIVDSQKCFRSQDIEEVGDNRHTTFFEMLGNWSLGDYTKNEQIPWLFEFLTKEIGIPVEKLSVTVFEGSDSVEKDEQSASLWEKIGIPKEKIYYYPAKKNWWSRSGEPDKMPVGEPGGPDSEVFYEFDSVVHDPKFGDHCHPNCDCGRFLEIGNSVFMEYIKASDGTLKELPQKNIDFGGGLERILAAAQDTPDIFQTDLFLPIIKEIEKITTTSYADSLPAFRVIADHLKAATFMISEGLEPSNKQQGYILRRLLRRAAIKIRDLKPDINLSSTLNPIISAVLDIYPDYFDKTNEPEIIDTVNQEMDRFGKTLDRGLKELEKFTTNQLNELNAFNLFQSYGFPYEISAELFKQKGKTLDPQIFAKIQQKHQDLSRTSSAGMFKGGLADHSEITTKYHTATHLLHAALRQILGGHVQQKGSNITAERLRFDFSHPDKLTEAQLQEVEDLINKKISERIPVIREEKPKDQAIADGALAFFGQKYSDVVSVYSIGNFSKELCGGPHVTNTQEIGKIKLVKQEAVGSNVRRLYLQLDNQN